MCYEQENYPEDRKQITHGQLLVDDVNSLEQKKKRGRKQMIQKHFFRVTSAIQNSIQLIQLTKIQHQKHAKLH